MNNEFDLTYVEALWVLGLLETREMPNVAAEALARGLDSRSLRQLAGLPSKTDEDVNLLFDQALKELNRGRMSKEEALKRNAKHISRKILNSEMTPLDGAKMIWKATSANPLPEFHDLDPFIYAASEAEERPKEKRFFENEIVAEAKRCSGLL